MNKIEKLTLISIICALALAGAGVSWYIDYNDEIERQEKRAMVQDAMARLKTLVDTHAVPDKVLEGATRGAAGAGLREALRTAEIGRGIDRYAGHIRAIEELYGEIERTLDELHDANIARPITQAQVARLHTALEKISTKVEIGYEPMGIGQWALHMVFASAIGVVVGTLGLGIGLMALFEVGDWASTKWGKTGKTPTR